MRLPALFLLVTMFFWGTAFRATATAAEHGPPIIVTGIRAALAAAVLVVSVPWIAAESGVSFAGVPALGTLFQTTEPRTQPGDEAPHPAVHAGHHHGMDGALLVWTALLFLPLAARHVRGVLRLAPTAYLALMLTYGLALVAAAMVHSYAVDMYGAPPQVPMVAYA